MDKSEFYYITVASTTTVKDQTLTHVAPEALIHGGVGAEAGRELAHARPGRGALVRLAGGWSRLVRALGHGPQVVNAREVSSWHGGT